MEDVEKIENITLDILVKDKRVYYEHSDFKERLDHEAKLKESIKNDLNNKGYEVGKIVVIYE